MRSSNDGLMGALESLQTSRSFDLSMDIDERVSRESPLRNIAKRKGTAGVSSPGPNLSKTISAGKNKVVRNNVVPKR